MSPNRESGVPLLDDGIFNGVTVYMVEKDVQPRRLEIWKHKLVQMGANLENHFSESVTHVLTANRVAPLLQIDKPQLQRFKGSVVLYQWLEDCLKSGTKLPEDTYVVRGFSEEEEPRTETDEFSPLKKPRLSPQIKDHEPVIPTSSSSPNDTFLPNNPPDLSPNITKTKDRESETSTSPSSASLSPKDHSPLYEPPDLNRNITEIFEKLVTIYRALGDDIRAFSYHKAIAVIEKVPFKIKRADQVVNSPGIGKQMQDHIDEIVTTGKMAKLEHLERDEKVKTLCLFGEVWGIGPATALKLYEKGHRTLDDLKQEDSLSHNQKLGLQYFDDIKCRIPRKEVEVMEKLLQDVGKEILPNISIICGGSYRRGKSSCGDLDVLITHPDGHSHQGFLIKYMKALKERNFLREDLIFSSHREEGIDSDVDTYYGLCTFPGRELRHRIDIKVYPRKLYAFGLIAWTGNDLLNRRLRLLAESKGYLLRDTGLYPATRGKERRRGTLTLHFDEEKEIFDFLGFPWLEPHQRNL